MNATRDPDDRIRRWLEGEAPADVPHHVLSAAFEQTHAMPQERPAGGAGPLRLIARRRTGLLLVAAFTAVGLLGVALGAGSLRAPAPTLVPRASLLDEVNRNGRLRIAVRPDHPQAPLGGVATGFDADVAAELARRLGIQPDVVIVDVTTMLGDDRHTWDVALPSTPDWLIDDGAFERSTPYYRWPHRLIVPATSRANAIGDLAGGPICVVAGDPSETWLRGGYDGAAAPATISVITRATDTDCLAALAAGEAIGAVTAHLSDADLAVLGNVRVIGGPDAEPRSVVVRRPSGPGPDPGDLLAAVDDALDAMRADGTLTRLSERRFGGADLTTP